MILLTSTSDLLQVITASAIGTDVHASYMEYNGSSVTPLRTNTAISTATTTTVVDHPGSSIQRNIKTLTIRNTDASSSQVITVQHTDGTTVATLIKATLQAKETLVYTDKQGFVIFDNGGNVKIGPSDSKIISTTLLTNTSSSTFTTSTRTNFIFIRMVGGGGQGGGATGGSSTASVGGGGGAGGYAEKLFGVAPNTGYTYQCGAAGSSASGNVNGSGGSNTTMTVGGTTVTAFGGNGGFGAMSAGSGVGVNAGGTSSSQSTGGDLDGAGSPGGPGLRLSGTVAISGEGGSGPFGAGGNCLSTDVAGNVGTGYGAGGGGACSLTNNARNGGAGTAGCIFVEEYT